MYRNKPKKKKKSRIHKDLIQNEKVTLSARSTALVIIPAPIPIIRQMPYPKISALLPGQSVKTVYDLTIQQAPKKQKKTRTHFRDSGSFPDDTLDPEGEKEKN